MTSPTALAETLVSTDLAEARGDLSHLSTDQRETLDRARVRLMQGDASAAHAVSAILDCNVRMPVYRWDGAVKAFDSLARKAAKRGLPEPTITEVSRETVGEGEQAEEWITARILGAAPVLDGWRCVATLTHSDDADEPYVYTAHGETFDAEGATMRCDHCGHSRRRHLVFVLRHEDSRTMLVGSTCLNEYLGTDALGAWFVWSRLHELRSTVAGWSEWSIADHAQWLAEHPEVITRGDTSRELPVPLRDFIAACVAEIAANGYTTSKAAWQQGTTATGRHVWTAYQRAEHVGPTDNDYARADEIIAWVNTLDREEYDAYGEPRYTTSLVWALDASRDGVDRSRANMLASSVTAYARELARREANAELLDEHLPDVAPGDRIVIDLTVVRDVGWALSCLDAERRTVLLQSTSYKDGNKGPVQVGDRIRVVGKIRDLSEYRGLAQTRMNYISIYHEGSTAKAVVKAARKHAQQRGVEAPSWAQ